MAKILLFFFCGWYALICYIKYKHPAGSKQVYGGLLEDICSCLISKQIERDNTCIYNEHHAGGQR